MPFYVTLPSHANRREFPNNQANWFKIRLPHPLRLPGGQWQAGLSAISYPCEFVRFGEERWVHYVDVLGPNHSQTGWKR